MVLNIYLSLSQLRRNALRLVDEMQLHKWMPQKIRNEKSTLVQVTAWCCQATIFYMSQGGLDLCPLMAPIGHNELIQSALVIYLRTTTDYNFIAMDSWITSYKWSFFAIWHTNVRARTDTDTLFWFLTGGRVNIKMVVSNVWLNEHKIHGDQGPMQYRESLYSGSLY